MPAGGGQTIIQAMYAAGANAKTPEQRQLYQDWKDAGQPSSATDPHVVAIVRAGMLPVDYGNTTYKGLLYMAAIVGGGYTLAMLPGMSAAGMDVASLGTTVPAGTAIAPSVDIGAGALGGGATTAGAGGTLASLGGEAPSASVTTPTLASVSDPLATAPADIGAGATVPATSEVGGAAAADAGTPGYVGSSIADTSAAADPVASLTSPAGANVPTGSLATSPAWTGTSAPATAVAGTSGSGFAQSLTSPTVLGGLLSGGLGLLGSYLQSSAAGTASADQLKAAEDALAVQTQMYNTNTALNVAQANQKSQAYNTTQANLGPYRAAGASALSMLGAGLGIPGYAQGNQTVVNAPPAVVPVAPLTAPAPIAIPGTTPTTVGTAVPRDPARQPATTTTATSVGPAQVGEQRLINGQLAQWDGQGWLAIGSSVA